MHGMGSSRRGNLSIPWGLQGVWELKWKLSPVSWGYITSVSSLGAAAEGTLHFGTLDKQGLSKGESLTQEKNPFIF